ncbi:UNKNOWN [Stylonychia lemnae]|uniref:Uncharacterized protein n=1 Tax=Stylonychia lemnae TaxID=5949 RepID=A0A078BBN3_STYLE|nr:UNKNOWN [Stylonychia lemnae]|eukprot:CDW91621.1 UNKNOWN [Stylonychia lemnae]
MKRLDRIVEQDPLKFKKFDGGGGGKSSKLLYLFLVGVFVLLILSFVFYVLAYMTSDSDPEPVVQTKNNPNNADDDDEYSNDLPPPVVRGDVFSDRSKIADSLTKVQVGLRIMPSQNDEQGIIMMHWTDEQNAQEKQLGDKVDLGDHYFLFQDTQFYFPVLKYNPDYVPFGDAASFCIHLQWIKRDMRRMYDMYKTVQGFPTCQNAINPKFRWQAEDPKTGVDFKVWSQEKFDAGSESECSSMGGVYRALKFGEGGRCYLYNIVKRICLMVAYTEHPETASYTWEYRGGCYQGGSIAVYERAYPGEEYHFDSIPIEVREDESLYNALGNVEAEVNSTVSPVFNYISYFCLFMAFVSGILFAIFFYKQWKGDDTNMRHQPQVDEQ